MSRPIGGIRIAKVMYEHHPIIQSEDGTIQSIGAMIDEHIANTIAGGNMISEVSLFFETPEQQNALVEMYVSKFVETDTSRDFGGEWETKRKTPAKKAY